MSDENVEKVRRGYAAFSRGDLEGTVADFAPAFEYVATGAIPGQAGVFRGAEEWTNFVGWMRSEFEDPRSEIRELVDIGDQVLVGMTLRGRGKQSGVETSWDVWHLWTMRDGKAIHCQGFTSRKTPSKPPVSRSASSVWRRRAGKKGLRQNLDSMGPRRYSI